MKCDLSLVAFPATGDKNLLTAACACRTIVSVNIFYHLMWTVNLKLVKAHATVPKTITPVEGKANSL